MKVTVCFGSVRVLVPCGAGDLLVRDLVREAAHRYKKATGQVSSKLYRAYHTHTQQIMFIHTPTFCTYIGCFRAFFTAFHWSLELNIIKAFW